jgi:hypothetical protein
VKTPEDEAAWDRAKDAAAKTLSPDDGDKYWALVMHIFKKMTHREEVDHVAIVPCIEEFRRLVGLPLQEEVEGLTAEKMAKMIFDSLPQYHKLMFKATQGQKLGGEDSVMITCAAVAKEAGELDAWNSKAQCMIHINRAPGQKWPMDGAAPEKVQAEQFRGTGVKMRAKTASPEKIVAYVIAFFEKNAAVFGAKE